MAEQLTEPMFDHGTRQMARKLMEPAVNALVQHMLLIMQEIAKQQEGNRRASPEPPPEAFAQASIEATPTPEIIEWAESVFDRETRNEAMEVCARVFEVGEWNEAASVCRALKRASP